MRLEQHHDRANDHKESHHVQQALAWEVQDVRRQVPFQLARNNDAEPNSVTYSMESTGIPNTFLIKAEMR